MSFYFVSFAVWLVLTHANILLHLVFYLFVIPISCNQVQYMGDHSHISMELDEVSLIAFYIVTRCIMNSIHGYHFHILIELDEVFIVFYIATRWLDNFWEMFLIFLITIVYDWCNHLEYEWVNSFCIRNRMTIQSEINDFWKL